MLCIRPALRATYSALIMLSVMFVPSGRACTWAVGYFDQVTALRGRVVGVNFHGLPRWFRESFARKHAKLMLYRYQSPRVGWENSLPVKTLETDENGGFDFGFLEKNHYTLRIDSGDLSDQFDVEVTDLPRNTDSVVIDISPVLPDCTGGHQFFVKFK